MSLYKGQLAPDFSIEDVHGNLIRLRDFKGKKVLLAFQRNTACPFCNYQLYKLSKIASQLKKQNLEILVFFESKKEILLSSVFMKDVSFPIISDAARRVYTLYGSEISASKLAATFKNPKFPALSAELKRLGFGGDGIQEDTNPNAIPSAFLIDEDGVLRHVHYGEDMSDDLPIEEIEKFASLSPVNN